ncbi:glycerol 3-phosphate dehydrogenase (NAD(P)+) [Desulfitobacterium sp. LBE]|uniref:NAD(P)H-dependent glycerol-3-phosphate dehydrogenase n=1 Tax=Desulfitobacterium sp. LBE TaxID=884086 RepID=UPI00119BF6B8|nr:NAD(P)H-dependent glycerol-3-phosphate dehydrogenase [Desulfitobacterium sp. LBE]TWH60814.1 glycerol 3-phosphate dehydrogenase (NAD(P)+) [Desulfitobacterium sp. LBE]
MAKIAVYGAGSWGTALAVSMGKAGHEVALVGRKLSEMDLMEQRRENRPYLPGVVLPPTVRPTGDAGVLEEAEMLVLSVPSHSVRETAQKIRAYLQPGTIVVNTAKGLEEGSHKRLSQVLTEELPHHPIVVLSGPSHAEEVGKDMPTTVVVASQNSQAAEAVQDMLMTPKFRVYTNPDTIGVELGGAFKNIIALCAGFADGLGFGDNTKAALMTRGIAEITRLGAAMGGNPLTFAGLAGVGDLIVTCTSRHSRNHRAGVALGEGKPLEQVLKEVGMVVEGVRTTRVAYELSRQYEISMPITEQAYQVLFQGADPRAAVSALMMRGKKHEIEEVALIAMEQGSYQENGPDGHGE